MEYLQYAMDKNLSVPGHLSFKPYYKWNTFNTPNTLNMQQQLSVLNLIINGIPSILEDVEIRRISNVTAVLNLIINGIPSIL